MDPQIVPSIDLPLDLRAKVAIPQIQRPKGGRGVPPSLPPSNITSSTKKRRRPAPKSRAGCQTCKMRHVKCDETRPACFNCVKTGRSCDFRTSRTPIESPSTSLSALALAPEDVHYFEYVRSILWDAFAGPFMTPIWLMVLQACHTEPCILHLTLGTGMLHQIYPFVVENPSDPSFLTTQRSAFMHYSYAIKCMTDQLAMIQGKADPSTWEISLLASFLFIAFEVLIGNEESAYWQTVSGLNLMKSALSTFHAESTTRHLPGNMEEIARAFNRLDIQSTTFSIGYFTQSLLVPCVPDSFMSLSHARDVLDSIIPNILSVIQSQVQKGNHERGLNEPRQKHPSELNALLQRWRDTFEKFLESEETSTVKTDTTDKGIRSVNCAIARKILMIHFWVAFVWTNTACSGCQLLYDHYLPAFNTIITLAEDIIALQPSRRRHYAADIEIIQPLFFVGQKCRDGKTRRRACSLLKDAGREGVWDGLCTAAACLWIISKEEEGLGGIMGHIDASREGFVEEHFRLRDATINMNRLGRKLKIQSTRTREDGTDELLEGCVGWGEVPTVVYREEDTLWQKGALFG